ncbi:MAG: bifunctional hydroxymethylpyrimidine kinase/phosphomethylpyrimidine kinase [Alphaproteobacteria bacterium]|jgi:hydroxymethylpyrimidine/phosphomethylpyrimidine kinase|nr:bifunctional hydroxymethylpyrimidine kinase/phosphomethylpyrimidine kinase [Alphaproteobacteria bacterium]
MENNVYTPPKVLSIAGFDGSCGAGLQADLKVFSAHKCYGLNVLTSLPIQNTKGVQDIYEIPASVIAKQLSCMFEDITPSAIKIGMLFNAEIIAVVAGFLKEHADGIPIVLDPVMVAKSGHHLLLPEAITTMKELLIPQVKVITPNLPEAGALLNCEINTKEEMENSAERLLQLGCQSVLLKGGHLDGEESNDFYRTAEQSDWLTGKRIATANTHGTGCTLSAAIAANIALGYDNLTSCKNAKIYTQHALQHADSLKMGQGKGSLHHFYGLWG